MYNWYNSLVVGYIWRNANICIETNKKAKHSTAKHRLDPQKVLLLEITKEYTTTNFGNEPRLYSCCMYARIRIYAINSASIKNNHNITILGTGPTTKSPSKDLLVVLVNTTRYMLLLWSWEPNNYNDADRQTVGGKLLNIEYLVKRKFDTFLSVLRHGSQARSDHRLQIIYVRVRIKWKPIGRIGTRWKG